MSEPAPPPSTSRRARIVWLSLIGAGALAGALAAVFRDLGRRQPALPPPGASALAARSSATPAPSNPLASVSSQAEPPKASATKPEPAEVAFPGLLSSDLTEQKSAL